MPNETVKILLEVQKRNLEYVSDLSQKLKEAQQSTEQAKTRLEELNQHHERHRNIVEKASISLRHFRRELFVLSFTAASAAAVIIGLSKSSESLAKQSDDLTLQFGKLFNAMGDIVSQSAAVQFFTFNVKGLAEATRLLSDSLERLGLKRPGGISRAAQGRLLGMESEIEALRGEQMNALIKRQQAERLKLLDVVDREERRRERTRLNERQRLQQENLRLSEFGLKREREIVNEFKRGLGTGLQTQASDVLFKFLQGERQKPIDILRGFQAVINREVATVIVEAVATKLFPPKDPTAEAVKSLQQCLCPVAAEIRSHVAGIKQIMASAANISPVGVGASLVGTITQAKADSLGAIGAVTGAIGGLFGGGGKITVGDIFKKKHSGGYIPSFQTGGEVPAMLQAGEFVVRRGPAQENRELLQNINAGMKGRSGNNFFIKIDAIDSESFERRLSSSSAREAIGMQVIRLIGSNSDVRQVIKDFA